MMKKEFVNPTMRFSFFSRENIVTDSGNMNTAMGELQAAGSEVSITQTSVKAIKESVMKISL